METKIIGHRGGVKGYPENTLVAFKKAVELGADGVEFDVQLTKDGEVVVIHDELIDRTMTGSGLLKDYTLSELRKMSAGEFFSPEFKAEKIPTLAEVLEIVKNLEVINIELKNFLLYPGLEAKVLKLVDQFKIRDQVIISSFNHYSLQTVKKLQPEIRTGALLMSKMINPADYSFKRGFDALHLHFLTADQEVIDKSHFMGMQLNVYTVNYPEAVIDLMKKGVDMIITDDLEMALEIREQNNNS
ncbi:glycerophosphoryl diester phosphodiesterase [Halanaerobium saccharolyticum]|uniref:Glycerophosphoryl diester phosphodiesterase n=1 Tax=Halanaerobium saccharolyticum TaxID=43595 RepID=A0A4R7ZE66_9FIRM|nr:glycerophosphodiester phosphodiesterase [Halanaerobium saccharolyticum]RAK09748.1 glycerophosphoryl diester phosphodiesterase [Halanaerobium saccharolyticum]TDW07310.1 glycerophosphoryl diester phosphodiesterase [Halanaerobium saccharolyticum]TDX61189.1 glycerophosphoryl diester phosphodiesterase [Halanaerobium saccharolyticum]